MNRNTVYDRACLGSIVYGQIMTDEANAYPVTEKELERFTEYAVLTHSLLIWANTDEDTLRARFRKRGDNYLTIKQILAARTGYLTLIPKLDRRLQVLEYDSSEYSAAEFINNHFSRIFAALFPATGYVTDYRAHRLLGYKRGG